MYQGAMNGGGCWVALVLRRQFPENHTTDLRPSASTYGSDRLKAHLRAASNDRPNLIFVGNCPIVSRGAHGLATCKTMGRFLAHWANPTALNQICSAR